MRKEELDLLIASIKEAACARCVVDLSTKVSAMSADMPYRMVFGKKYSDGEFDDRGFKIVIQEGMKLLFEMQVMQLKRGGLTKRMTAVAKVFDAFLEKIIDGHVQSKDENRTKDFVDVMLSFEGSEETEIKVKRERTKAIILDMLAAAMDTSAIAVEWGLSELLKHPKVIKKLQKELEKSVGLSRMVEESDLENLEYLDMIVKETLRLHPAVPLLIPHESIEDCTVNRFHITKKSRVIINVWAIGRDPESWNDPEICFPKRFVGSSIDLRGRDFQLLPFGFGRRVCLRIQLGSPLLSK
ncbi:hypothetical protein CUMW_186980 [Citrus unshiu]|nr:hypothetical protein CUMW_186980 [Citrus unshiu]